MIITLVVIAIALVVGHVMAIVIDRAVGHDVFTGSELVVRLFNMDGELNIPAWYSASVLLGCAGLVLVISRTDLAAQSGSRRQWIGLAAVLAFLSVDEATAIHEELSGPLTEEIGLDPGSWEYWAWVLPYTAFAIVLVVVYWRFLLRLPALTRRLFLVAGAAFVAGAAGLELVGSRFYEKEDISLVYLTLVGLEEVTEMAAVAVLVYALLRFLADQVGPVRFAWSGR